MKEKTSWRWGPWKNQVEMGVAKQRKSGALLGSKRRCGSKFSSLLFPESTKGFLLRKRAKMDASRACLSSAAASSSGRGCQAHDAAARNGRSPSWRAAKGSNKHRLVVVVAAAASSSSASASSSPSSPNSSSSSSSLSPELQSVPNWPHTPGARRMPQQMRRRGTGTALLSSSSLRTTPATTSTTSSGGDPSSNLIDGVETRFVAETLLPTRLGKFRLRGYLHTVRLKQAKEGRRGSRRRPFFSHRPGRSSTSRFDLSSSNNSLSSLSLSLSLLLQLNNTRSTEERPTPSPPPS